MTIGRRLSLLVLSELLTAVIVVATGLSMLRSIYQETQYLRSFVSPPLTAIGGAFEQTGVLDALARASTPEARRRSRVIAEQLETFLERYRGLWQSADSPIPPARHFQALLIRANRTKLLDDERDAVRDLEQALPRFEGPAWASERESEGAIAIRLDDVATLRTALTRLNLVNLQQDDFWRQAYEGRIRSTLTLLVLVGLVGILIAPLLGLSVRQAIVPRVRLLVEKVRRFRELGINEPLDRWSGDELGVLATALDVSFRAIAERDKERERFLAIAAHEIKTPLSTMKGFAQAALAHPGDAAVRERALVVIDRQATRLARLTQDLLWSVRERSGKIPFNPAPLDLEALVRRVVREVGLAVQKRTIALTSTGDAHLLGDAALLEHAIWRLLTQAEAITAASTSVSVTLDAGPQRIVFAVEAPGAAESLPADLDTLFEPFVVLQYEGGSDALRGTGLGLLLVQRIARLHRAVFRIARKAGASIVFSLELDR